MKKKIAKVSAASLITLSMTVGNVTAINGINDTNEAETNENEEILENKTQETNSVSGENAIQNDTTNQQNSETETSVDSKSEEKSLEDREVIGKTTFVDENGNVKEVEVRDGTTGETYNPNARTVSTANMVNFNCSAADSVITYTDYNIGQSGYLSKASAADAAFLGYENGKVKFMVSGVVGLVDANKVEVVSQGTYYASNYEVNSKGMLYHYISNNVNATGNQGNYNYVGVAPSYLQKGIEYYSYDGHYFYTDYNVMINDYKNNVRSNSVNANNPYYNYFQYLPLRSKTNYSGAQLTSYLNSKANSSTSKLNNAGDLFVKYQEKNGVNALLAASVAALESGWGKSSIAINKNNLFGLNAADSNPGEAADTFASVEACISDFTENWMSERYLNAEYTSRYRGGYFGDKGSGIFGQYSSDVYEGEKCASIAANMDSGITSADLNYYTIGIKDASSTTYTGLAVKKEANDSSATLYTTIKNPAYAFIVRKKALNNGYYEVQSDSSLTSDRNDVSGNGEYNFSNNYGYVKSNSLTIVNSGNDVTYPSNSINQAPVITDAKITNVSKNGYTVTCKVTDDSEVTSVLMPTWSENGGQDDLIWYETTKSGDIYTLNVKTSDHNNDTGKYNTHIYAYDAEGKTTVVRLETEVPENQAPVITGAKITNVSKNGYTVTCKVTDDSQVTSVLMPTWSENGGQDDLIWYETTKSGDTYTLNVKTSDHNND
uniref:GBS Bsp-like repeat-containing protein n=1 Tax=uncultured Thomasclavelia sp. TaxID=3025759 RepID=UPI002628049D